MEKKFFIRGYREEATLPSLYDDQAHSLEEAIYRAKAYFKKLGIIAKIEIYDSEPHKKRAATVTITEKWMVHGN